MHYAYNILHILFFFQVVAVVSCMFVVVSTLCLIFSTLPRYQQKDEHGIICKWKGVHSTNYLSLAFSEEENFFEIAEAVFVGWFTFEYVIRFIAAPHKLTTKSSCLKYENCQVF